MCACGGVKPARLVSTAIWLAPDDPLLRERPHAFMETRTSLASDPTHPARWCALITVLAVQGIPEVAAASLRRNDPRAIDPGRLMADMLLVATFQVCHPILEFVLMKTNDGALHSCLVCDPDRRETYGAPRCGSSTGTEKGTIRRVGERLQPSPHCAIRGCRRARERHASF